MKNQIHFSPYCLNIRTALFFLSLVSLIHSNSWCKWFPQTPACNNNGNNNGGGSGSGSGGSGGSGGGSGTPTYPDLGCASQTLENDLSTNGDFETPLISGNYKFNNPGNMNGWTSPQTEIGKGQFYNSRWPTGTQVIELDGDKLNLNYSQTFPVEIGSKYKFELQAAPREGKKLNSSGFSIYIANKMVFNQGVPSNYEIVDFSYDFIAEDVSILISIVGLGTPDSFGTTVDNVKLQKISSESNSYQFEGVCLCDKGYFMNSSNKCEVCSSHCLECSLNTTTSSSECSKCENEFKVELVTGGCEQCTYSMPGCMECLLASNAGCPSDKCDSSLGWVFISLTSSCSCEIGLFAKNGKCELCMQMDPFCLECSYSAGTFNCHQCQNGSFVDNGKCSICSSIHYACTACSASGDCLDCEGDNWKVENGVCTCSGEFFEDYTKSECSPCSEADSACNLCENIENATAGQYGADLNETFYCEECSANFFSNSHFCEPCNNSLAGCINCSQEGDQCFTCDEESMYFLDSYDELISFHTNCTKCTLEMCTNCSSLFVCIECNTTAQYFLNPSTNLCEWCPLEGCIECREFNECEVCNNTENYFMNLNQSICSQCVQEGCLNCSTLTECYECDIASNYLFDNITETCFPCLLEGCKQCITNETCELCGNGYYEEPNSKLKCEKKILGCNQDENGLPSDPAGVPLLNYTASACETAKSLEKIGLSITISSYTLLLLSLFSGKIIGLELFGVLQMAYFNLADHSFVNLYLAPLLNWGYVNGFNVDSSADSKRRLLENEVVPKSVAAIGYTHSFIENMNVMLLIIVVELIVSVVLVLLTYKFKILYTASSFLIKEIFITIFLFNCFNISFSAGLHFRYATHLNTQNYHLSTFAAVIGLLLSIFAIIGIEILETSFYGEFKNKFKKGFLTNAYISISIVYRMVLGFSMALANDNLFGNLFILSTSLVFILYNIVNLPFVQAYQNYRANFCHWTQLVILLVTNFYTIMRANEGIEQKAMIFSPAQIEIILVFLCVFISLACLIYEIYLMIVAKYYSSDERKVKGHYEKEKMRLNSTENFEAEQNQSKATFQ